MSSRETELLKARAERETGGSLSGDRRGTDPGQHQVPAEMTQTGRYLRVAGAWRRLHRELVLQAWL